MHNYTDFQLALIKARKTIMTTPSVAFFAALLLQLETIEDESIPTACTNGLEIRYNPNFFLSLNHEERIFLILHEVLHVAYSHVLRRHNRNPLIWNFATDYVINDYLNQQGFKIIKGALYDKKFQGQLSEQVYEYLLQHAEEHPQDFNADLDYSASENKSPEELKELAKQHKQLLSQAKALAEMMHKGIGQLPQDLARELDKLFNPKLSWNVILRRFLQEVSKNDYTWMKPNLNYLSHGLIIPSLHSEGLSYLDFVIDVSGSISSKEFNQFVSEVGYIIKQFNPKQIGVMQFDYIVQDYSIITNLNQLKQIKFKGGGGTDIYPVLKQTNTHNCKAVIILTDGYFEYTNIQSNKPIIWCVYNNPSFKPKIGSVIHFEKDTLCN